MTVQCPFSTTVSAPKRGAINPHPTISFGVSNKTNIKSIGSMIWQRCRTSWPLIRISSVNAPKALMPCLRDWNEALRNRHRKYASAGNVAAMITSL